MLAISISRPWPAQNSEVLIEPHPQAHFCLIARTAGNGSGDEAIILGDWEHTIVPQINHTLAINRCCMVHVHVVSLVGWPGLQNEPYPQA